jgi:glycosyltransferase involved in cell wall biosynthesis
MHVLSVLRDRQPLGGKQQYAFDLAALLRAGGARVTWLTMGGEADADTIVLPRLAVDSPRLWARLGAAYRRLYNRSAYRAVQALARRARPDLAHLHDHVHFSTALLDALADLGIPVVYTLHDFQLLCPVSVFFRQRESVHCEACRGGRYHRAVRYRCSHGKLANSAISALDNWLFDQRGAARIVARFIAPSRFVRQKFIEFGWDGHQIEVIPHPAPCAWAAVPPPDDGPILCVARLWRQKGVHVLLEALARLNARGLPVVIAGDGPEREALSRRAAALGLTSVRFIGSLDRDAIQALYRQSRWVVVPSLWPEVFGLVCVEAFASGRAVIAAAIGGLPELVTPGADGWLFPPGDAEALAERMDWMLRHPEAARAMGAAARQKAERDYSPERHYQRIYDLYQTVLHKR